MWKSIPKQWGLQAINARQRGEITQGDENVILAIIDSGVDGAHPEFAGKTFLEGFDALGKNEYIDPNGHGTHVAGIAADDGRTGSMAGVAWKSPIMSLRVAMPRANANIMTSPRLCFISRLCCGHENKRIVANMSLGTPSYSYALKDAVDYVISRGVVVVAAAGNSHRRIAFILRRLMGS